MQSFEISARSSTATWAEWGELRLERLLFSEAPTARQVVLALIGLAAIFIVIRSFGSRNPGHHRMALPAHRHAAPAGRARRCRGTARCCWRSPACRSSSSRWPIRARR